MKTKVSTEQDTRLDADIKRKVGRNFFNSSFRDIKKHPAIQHLHLTDEEIIKNRHEIQTVIHSWQCCGESKVFCNSLKSHYTLKRNHDDDLVLTTFTCNKRKNYEDITKEEIDERIKHHLLYSDVPFDLAEIKELIKSYKRDESSAPDIINKHQIGSYEYTPKNIISVKKSDNDRKKHLLYLFHSMLLGFNTIVIRSEKIKRAALAEYFNEKENDDQTINNIKKTQVLIILDFGVENNTGKNYYYLDFIPELIRERKMKDRITYIFSLMDFGLICEDIKNNNYYQNGTRKNKEIQAIKLEELTNTIMQTFRAP